MIVKVLGIDIAKNVFQLHGVDDSGNLSLKKRLNRKSLLVFLSNMPACLIGMEACSTSNYWGRELTKLGHKVKLISPQFVKPYVKTNKNDYNDAEAICEAVTRPNMRFVAIKSIDQQDVQALHRMRSRIVEQRTGLVNHIRGVLSEYGLILPQGISQIRNNLRPILESPESLVSPMIRDLMQELLDEFVYLDQRVERFDQKIKLLSKENEICQRLTQVPGIGPITATALVAAIGDIKFFENGRHLSAWLGLVPKQNSSGHKNVLLGISKRGDKYLRKLLVHGARAVIFRLKNRSQWITDLVARRGANKACVALANKTARIVWALMSKGESYRPLLG